MKKNKRIIIFIGALLFSIVYSLLFKWVKTGNPFKTETLVYGVIIFLNILILGYVGYFTLNKFSKKSALETKRKIIPSFLMFIFFTLLISLSLVSIGVYSFYLIKGFDTSNFLNHLFTVELNSAIKQFAIWILLSSVFFFYMIYRKAVEQEQKLREESLKYKYRNLRSQVNPHFLFNSLNTLSEIIYEDTKKADAYIQKLSGIYRYILDKEETDLISLNEELEFVKQYFYLQQERDNDKIQLEINFHGADKFRIIPVSLQILVENALKHNSMSEKTPLKIQIYNSNGYIVVSNVIQRKTVLSNSLKTGLSNLTERVKLITGKEMIVTQENNQFIVKLPIIRG